MTRLATPLLAALLVAVAPPAGAAAPGPARSALEARSGRLLASVDVAPAFPPELQKQLANGLTNVIALHVALLPDGEERPIAIFGRTIDVLYDVWEETFGVLVKDPQTPLGRRQTFRTYRELRAFLTEARGVDLGPVADLGNGRWVLQTRVEVNPVSKELLERTREFIANPTAAGRGGGPSRSVLGTMASYLLRGADPGADVHLFRSGPFTAGDVERR
ncbi:MAG TPA: hypothetical protein VFP65_21240 [Anaeromyxobacteraceae bacterium]|nr:hypothetical protein [Anaeromyxobacteraceae bacterium]